MNNSQQGKSIARRFQFSLRALMMATMLVAITTWLVTQGAVGVIALGFPVVVAVVLGIYGGDGTFLCALTLVIETWLIFLLAGMRGY